MVNLLFDTEVNPQFTSLISGSIPEVIEIVTFKIRPESSIVSAKKALTTINDIVKLYPGFIKRITGSSKEGRYVDIVYWKNIELAKMAATEIMKDENAIAAFKVIEKETTQIDHFDIFNSFEG